MNYLLALESQQLLILAGATIAGAFLLLRVLKNRREPTADPLKAFQRTELPSRNQEPPLELVRWEVQMHDTARELKAELDSKMVALQVLIRQAERECQRLEQLLEKTKNRES